MATTSKPATPETPPYLKQAHIRDYRSIRDAKVSFKPGLNIIIGENGAGKTNFINLTENLISLYEKHINGLECEIILGGMHEFKINFIETSNYDPPFQYLDNTKLIYTEVTYESKTRTGATLFDTIEDIDEKFRFTENPILYDIVSIKHGIPSTKMYVTNSSTDLTISKRKVSINDNGDLKLTGESGSGLISNILFTIGMSLRSEYFSKSKGTVVEIDTNVIKHIINKIFERYFKQIALQIRTYTPIKNLEVDKSFQVYYNKEQDEILIKGLKINFYIRDKNIPLPFDSLSDGTKRLFFIISEIFTSMLFPEESGFLIDDYKRDKIIFLEEPELGIHPDQLQKLLILIREVSRENQVIMTTHSPQVLDMLAKNELDRITICELDPKKGTQFRKLSAAKKAKAKAYMQDNSYLSDFWRFSNLEDPD